MNSRSRILSIVVTCALAGAAYAAGPTHSSSSDSSANREPVTLTIRYQPRDLATRDGAERVYRRLLLEARRKCSINGTSVVEMRRVDARCVNELVDNAVARMGSVQLASMHRGLEQESIAAGR